LEASQAIDIANNSTSTVHPLVVDNADSGFDVGQKVTVTPEDYGAVPVAGLLERATMSDIAIRREDERAGDVVVHFPRAGYRLEANE
jgi:hypothetical protein